MTTKELRRFFRISDHEYGVDLERRLQSADYGSLALIAAR